MKRSLLTVLGLLAALWLSPLAAEERKILYWVDPMDPNMRGDKPGISPMGMEMVPYYEGQGGEEGVVTISPTVVNNLGVRTAPVAWGSLERRVETVGFVAYDENRVSHVHLRTEGWIERLLVKAVGERVRQGQLLFELYSPTLVNAQEEFLQTLGNSGLAQASRKRLRVLGISESQIERLAATRKVEQLVAIHAPQDGVVTEMAVREGMFVEPEMDIMTLVDLSTIWLLANVYESQSAWVRPGLAVEARFPYFPGRVWSGLVEYVYPELDATTRTLKARMRLDNSGETLKPNMYAQVMLQGDPAPEAFHVPREALIRTGNGDRVLLALGEGKFKPQEVTVGMESGERVAILAGLQGGETVVVSGQFLIDSEASLSASMTRLSAPVEHDHVATAADAKPVEIVAEGVVNKTASGKINLTHDPIPALGWPAMTMDFDLADGGVTGEGFTQGMRVRFFLEKTGQTSFRIIKLEKVAEHAHGGQP